MDSDASRSRDLGPITPSTAYAEVTSTTRANAPAGIRRRMWSRSRSVVAELATSRNSSADSRVTVRSDS